VEVVVGRWGAGFSIGTYAGSARRVTRVLRASGVASGVPASKHVRKAIGSR